MYKLNDIPLSTYGITPGRMDGEHLAVKGIFDLPKRTGDTHYSWAETNGIQPFVDADEIFLDGRTIYFQGILQGNTATLKSFLNAFKTAIDGFNDVVPFETPYGTYCVLVSKVTPKFYHGGALVLIEFNEPQVGASCSIGTAPTIYYSAEYTESSTKNNCANGYYGSTVTLTAAAGKFTSTVSQAAADLLAVQWVRDYKQDYANANGTCTINPTVYYNVKATASLQKNDCDSGYFGTAVSYEVPAFKYSSLISQEDADAQANAEISTNFNQAYANANGSCVLVFYNEYVEFSRAKNDCGGGYTGQVFTINMSAGMMTSTISQEDANNKALAELQLQLSQSYVNTNGTCISNVPAVTLVGNTYKVIVSGLVSRTKTWRIGSPVTVGETFNFIAFGIVLSYTVTDTDTASTIATELKNIINNTSVVGWNAQNMFPKKYGTNAKPKATTSGSDISVVVFFNTDPSFNLYTS